MNLVILRNEGLGLAQRELDFITFSREMCKLRNVIGIFMDIWIMLVGKINPAYFKTGLVWYVTWTFTREVNEH